MGDGPGLYPGGSPAGPQGAQGAAGSSNATSSNTSSTAAATTPTLGAAAQLAQTTHDAMIYIDVTVVGNLVVAIGPTSGVANTLFSGTFGGVGAVTVRLPAGWYIAVTTSNTAVWTATAITC